MDLENYVRQRNAQHIVASRAIRYLPPSGGVASSVVAGWLETDQAEQQATQYTVPKQPSAATNVPVAGAPARAGGPLESIPEQLVKGGHVEPVFNAETRSKSAKAVSFKTNDPVGQIQDDQAKHHNGLGTRKSKKDLTKYGGLGIGRGGTSRPSVGPAVAKLIDRWASADQVEAERQIFRRASELYRRGYHKSSSLNVIVPPDYAGRTQSSSGGTLNGFSPFEVSGAMPPESSVAEVSNKASGYMVGKFTEPLQAAHELAAAQQPKSFTSGVLFPVGTQPGFVEATGYAADSTASPETIGGFEEARMEAITDPYGTVTNKERVKRGAASRSKAEQNPNAAPLQPTGGVMIQVKQTSAPPTPAQEAKAGAESLAAGEVSVGGIPQSSAGQVIGVAPSSKTDNAPVLPVGEDAAAAPLNTNQKTSKAKAKPYKSSMFKTMKPITSMEKKR